MMECWCWIATATVIDNGTKLFGDNTSQTLRHAVGAVAASGFNALLALNTNADGKIDAQFANLRVWRDLRTPIAHQGSFTGPMARREPRGI